MSDNLPDLYAELERIGTEASEWAQVEASDSTALVHVGSGDPERIREQMIEVRREARHKSGELQKAADKVRSEIRAELDRQRGEMEARMQAAMAALAPLQAQVKRMEEGIWTVNLYLGTSEQIVTLRTGKPAPQETPIHLRTSVLAMDQEVAAFPAEAGKTDWQGMDFRDVETFDRWLVEEPEHLDQVLPEDRGIVVFTPRATEKIMHEDPLVNAMMNEHNFESYWLIRNGENLYRMQTDFAVGKHLMPVTSQFTALFQTKRYNHTTGREEITEIKPGTREWEQAEKAQDGIRRHYMRVALIVQGLIDRTEVLQPLHAAVNVMQQATYDDGLVVVINDTEKAIGTGREPYYDWIRRLCRELRPGMRVIGNFAHKDFKDFAYDWRSDRPDSSRNKRLSPPSAEYPVSNVIHYIDGKRSYEGQPGLVFKYERTEKVWTDKWVESPDRPGWGNHGGYVMPKRRASAVILPGHDQFVIPFDLVTEEEMREYLTARTERHAYADSFPLLQAAIAAKVEEREAEAPFRDLLTRVLAEDNDQTTDEVAPFVDDLVHRYKLGNKWHRPLVSLSQDDEAKALRLIRAEYKRIVNSGADAGRDEHAVAVLREHDPEVMFVGRLSSGKYVAFAPMPRAYGSGAASPNLWVREHTTGKTARSIATREWITPGTRGSKMTSLFATDQWAEWDYLHGPADDLTDAEIEALSARVMAGAVNRIEGTVLAVEHNRAKRTWTLWAADMREPEQPVQHSASIRKIVHTWERVDGAPKMSAGVVKTEEFDLSYGGNRTLGSGIDATKREVYMPWHTGRKRSFGERQPEVREPASSVVFEADEKTLDRIAQHVRKVEGMKDEWSDLRSLIYTILRIVERQQVDEQVEKIKAEFLAQYPDEEMWEERRAGLTKDLRPAIKVTDDWHFKRRVRTSENTHSLHDREGYLDLDSLLRLMAVNGQRTFTGITIRDAYRLADEPMADVYEPIADLVLMRAEVEAE